MTNTYRFGAGILLIVVFCAVGSARAQELRENEPRDRWLVQVRADLTKLDKEDQTTAAQFLVIAVAESGDGNLAKEIMREFISAEMHYVSLLSIAGIQSANGQLKDALATVAELSTEGQRQAALSMVITHQARRGNVVDAEELLPKIKSGSRRDSAILAIAVAHGVAGNRPAAMALVEQISDAEKRSGAKEKVDREISNPVSKIKSRFLRQQVHTMAAFFSVHSAAVEAIVAAERNDSDSLDKHAEAALNATSNEFELVRATNHKMLAAAFAEAGRVEEAKRMIKSAKSAANREPIGIMDLHGDPILMHVYVQLRLNDELSDFLSSMKTEEAIGRIAYHSSLIAAGASFAALNRLDEADRFRTKLESLRERVYFGVGVITELRGESNSP